MRQRITALLVGTLALLTLIGPTAAAAHDATPGAVYTLTNGAAGNAVTAFRRGADGTLSPFASYPTGGTGSGAGLGSQGALTLSADGRWLLAVDAGSNDLAVFRVRADGSLRLADREGSRGTMPISVTIHGDLVYVLNAGGIGNIVGLRLRGNGALSAIPGSARPLTSGASGPAEVSFNPRGDLLVVTEKATNQIAVYDVHRDGRASGPRANPSAGTTPFGFAFDPRGRAIVSEAFGGAPGASTLSSYGLSDEGVARVISPVVATTQTAACWVVTTSDGRFAYTTNTGSASISSFAIGRTGRLTLKAAVASSTGAGPIDAAIDGSGRFLYVLSSGSHAVNAFRILGDGSLAALPSMSGLPASAVGLAAR